MTEVDLSQCNKVFVSRSSNVYNVATLLLTGGLAVISQLAITPLLDESNEAVIDGCPKKQDLKDSLKTFIQIASAATFVSLFMTLVLDLYQARLFKKYGTSIGTLSSKLATGYKVATGIKAAFLLAALASVFKAFRSYPACKHFQQTNIKKSIAKQITNNIEKITALPSMIPTIRS